MILIFPPFCLHLPYTGVPDIPSTSPVFTSLELQAYITIPGLWGFEPRMLSKLKQHYYLLTSIPSLLWVYLNTIYSNYGFSWSPSNWKAHPIIFVDCGSLSENPVSIFWYDKQVHYSSISKIPVHGWSVFFYGDKFKHILLMSSHRWSVKVGQSIASKSEKKRFNACSSHC